jgi:signal transduction histidine kinase/streptogramin lyase
LKLDSTGNVWVLRTRGLERYGSDGTVTSYGPQHGWPDSLGTGALLEDRFHMLWIGSGNKLARIEQGRFQNRAELDIGTADSVRCLFEDQEGSLWVGSNSGLRRLRDGPFTVYGKTPGWPGGEANTVFQDRTGMVWMGISGGAAAFRPGPQSKVTRYPNIASKRVFSFRETQSGDLLVSSGDGLARVHSGAVKHYIPTGDPLGRKYVYDAMEGAEGQIWLALPSGLAELKEGVLRYVVRGGPTFEDAVLVLAMGKDGSVWAGGRRSLWQVKGDKIRRYGTADGLTSSAIASLYMDPEGTLWIGTAGGGLNRLQNGKFEAFRAKDGLLSDNISEVLDDGGSLWLSTARGISRLPKQQLLDFCAGKISALRPIAFAAAEGLRTAAFSPPAGAGGGHFANGNLWLATTSGLALHQPHVPDPTERAPIIDLTEMTSEGKALDWLSQPHIPAGNGHVQIRYTAVNLRTPERIQYSYKLDGLDSNWVHAGTRRAVDYDGLRYGPYTFHVRAELPGGVQSERAFRFDVLPRFYETNVFRVSLAAFAVLLFWGGYQLRERRVRSQFVAVLEERARLAREVHDTLAQGFVGISSQLDVVEMCLPKDATAARSKLDLARRMAHHSLTEARRSVMDLRSTALEDTDLATALESSSGAWTAGSGVKLNVEVTGERRGLPEDVAHHMLRIAQEAVTNALKHAHAAQISLKLRREAKSLRLEVNDDGCGFERDEAFLATNGHFGLIGMRERAQRLGGELYLESQPGHGTQLAIQVPIA